MCRIVQRVKGYFGPRRIRGLCDFRPQQKSAFRLAAMPRRSRARDLHDLTEVPAGWPLATVIDAFAYLAPCPPSYGDATRAFEAVSHRLVDLWSARPAEAEAWLQRCRENIAMELKEARPEELQEALFRYGAAEYNGYAAWRFSEAGLLRGKPRRGTEAERERWAAVFMQQPHVSDRCRELAERVEQAESPQTARKRQKLRRRLEAELHKSQEEECRDLRNRLAAVEAEVSRKDAALEAAQSEAAKCKKIEEESAERRHLEAELQKSQEEEGRELSNRLAAAEAEVSLKATELQTAQSQSATCKERCEEFATRAAAAEAAAAESQKELRQLQEEHSICQEHCEELAKHMAAEASEHAKTKELLAQAEADAAEKQLEVKRLQEEGRSYRERCPKTDSQPASAEEAGSKAGLQLEKEKAVLQGRFEQLQHQLAKAEAKLELMQNLREQIGVYKERLRVVEHQLTKKQWQDAHHFRGPAFNDAAASGQESNLAEQLGYSFVESEDDGTCSSLLSHCSWFSVKPDSVKPHCFMLDAIFKTRSYGTDFFLMGRDLKKGSQVVAGDDATVLTVTSTPEICDATEIVDLQAGAATLQVTPDHWVQVFDAKGGSDDYLPAGALKTGDWVMLDSGEPVALTSAKRQATECKVLKIRLEPNLPVAVFSRPACILSWAFPKKAPTRRGRPPSHTQRGGGPSDESMDVPSTAGGEYGK